MKIITLLTLLSFAVTANANVNQKKSNIKNINLGFSSVKAIVQDKTTGEYCVVEDRNITANFRLNKATLPKQINLATPKTIDMKKTKLKACSYDVHNEIVQATSDLFYEDLKNPEFKKTSAFLPPLAAYYVACSAMNALSPFALADDNGLDGIPSIILAGLGGLAMYTSASVCLPVSVINYNIFFNFLSENT